MNSSIFYKAIFGIVMALSVNLFSAGVFAYVSNSRDNSVSVIDTATDTVVQTIDVGFFPTDIAASSDGSFVYTSMFAASTIYAISTATNETQNVIAGPQDAKPIGIAVAPNGNVYCVNFSNDTVFVIDPASMTEIADFPLGSTFPLEIAINPAGTRAYVVCGQGPKNLRVIDLANNHLIATLTTGTQPMGVAVSPDGNTVYVTNRGSDTVTVIDATTNTIRATVSLTANSNPRGVVFRPDGLFAYVALQGTSSVAVIDTSTDTVSTTIALTSNSDPYGVAITPDGTKGYITNTLTGEVSVIDTATNTVTGTVTVGNFPYSVAIANVP